MTGKEGVRVSRNRLLWAKLCSSERDVEAITLSTWECDLIWK